MAGVQASALAIARVSQGRAWQPVLRDADARALRGELAAIAASGVRQFHINFFAHTPPAPDVAREAAWRCAGALIYADFGIDARKHSGWSRRMPFSPEALEPIAPFKPPVVSFHLRPAPDELLAPIRAWGGKISVVGDDAGGGALAGRAWCRCHHRAGAGGGVVIGVCS